MQTHLRSGLSTVATVAIVVVAIVAAVAIYHFGFSNGADTATAPTRVITDDGDRRGDGTLDDNDNDRGGDDRLGGDGGR